MADTDDDLMLEDNDDDEVLLENNADSSDADSLVLEDNAASDDDSLVLEENEDDDSLVLEENVDDDSLQLEDNDDDGLMLEDNEGEAGVDASSATGPSRGLQNALDALSVTPMSGGGGIVDPEEFLIPSARAKLEAALQSTALDRFGPKHKQNMTLQALTAHEPEECFMEAAKQLIAKFGERHLAARMRLSGDDHFAAGAFSAARHCYSAGLKHCGQSDAADIFFLWVNRAAAHLKQGNAAAAIDDCGSALQLAEEHGVQLLKMRRKALLRRAAAYLECRETQAARADLLELPASDSQRQQLEARLAQAEESDAEPRIWEQEIRPVCDMNNL
jgi:hypothetical protein